MTLIDIIGISGVGILIILGLIRIKPLEISILHWILKKIGNCFNDEVLQKVQNIDNKVNQHLEDHGKEYAETNRQRILRFADEVYDGQHHSKESFDNIREIIRKYSLYCETHPDFINNQTEMAVKIINDTYIECFKEHKFKEE